MSRHWPRIMIKPPNTSNRRNSCRTTRCWDLLAGGAELREQMLILVLQLLRSGGDEDAERVARYLDQPSSGAVAFVSHGFTHDDEAACACQGNSRTPNSPSAKLATS